MIVQHTSQGISNGAVVYIWILAQIWIPNNHFYLLGYLWLIHIRTYVNNTYILYILINMSLQLADRNAWIQVDCSSDPTAHSLARSQSSSHSPPTRIIITMSYIFSCCPSLPVAQKLTKPMRFYGIHRRIFHQLGIYQDWFSWLVWPPHLNQVLPILLATEFGADTMCEVRVLRYSTCFAISEDSNLWNPDQRNMDIWI